MDVFHVFYILQNATKSRKASHIKKLIGKSKAANLLFSLFANITGAVKDSQMSLMF